MRGIIFSFAVCVRPSVRGAPVNKQFMFTLLYIKYVGPDQKISGILSFLKTFMKEEVNLCYILLPRTGQSLFYADTI